MDGETYDIVVLALRTIFLVSVPLIAALAIAGAILSVIQAATAIDEPAIGHAVRILVLAAVLYRLFPFFADTFVTFAEAAFR